MSIEPFLLLLLLSFILIACSSNNLYNQKIEEAQSALHEEDYNKAIELIEAALIEKPNDQDAKALLEMAKSKHTKIQLNKKVDSDLNIINQYFSEFLNIYSTDYTNRIFTEKATEENVDFFKEGMDRIIMLESILSKVVSFEVDSSLVKLKADVERAVELEIEATKAGQVIFLFKDLDHSDPKADPINQFGNAMDTLTNTTNELHQLVPVKKYNRYKIKLNKRKIKKDLNIVGVAVYCESPGKLP